MPQTILARVETPPQTGNAQIEVAPYYGGLPLVTILLEFSRPSVRLGMQKPENLKNGPIQQGNWSGEEFTGPKLF